VQIGSFNYRVERAIRDSICDIDLTRFVRTHGLDRNWPLASARRLRIHMLSVYKCLIKQGYCVRTRWRLECRIS